MQNVTTEKAVNNQVASAKMEGFRFNKESLDIISKYADNKISHDQLVELVTQICTKKP